MKWFLFAALPLFISCHTPDTTGVSTTVYNLDPDTRTYHEVLKKFWRTETVFSNYETLYILNVAAFLPDFQNAFKKVNDDRLNGIDLLKSVKTHPSFFVSIYSPHDELNVLTNDRIWEFMLKVGIREYPVKTVTKLKDKDTWSAFFPFVSRWSSDFLISFDIPDSDKLTSAEQLSLFLTNAQAKTEISWNAR